MNRILKGLICTALLMLLPRLALASCSALPFTLTNGTTADATQVMSNFNTVRTCATTVDNTQIGVGGVFPIQILPTSVSNNIFGGASPLIGFQFGPYGTGLTPLTVAAPTGVTVDIVDVTLNANKVFAIDKNGISYFAPGAALSVPGTVAAGDIVVQEGVSSGRVVFGGATTSGILDFGVTTAATFTFNNTLAVAGNISTTTASNGNIKANGTGCLQTNGGANTCSGKIGFTAVLGFEAIPIGATYPPVAIPGASIYQWAGTINNVDITTSRVDCGTASTGTTTFTLGNGLTAIALASASSLVQSQSTVLSLPVTFTVTAAGGSNTANCTVEISGWQQEG